MPYDYDVICFEEVPEGDWVRELAHTWNVLLL